jgi:hypothetical protein
MRWFLGRQNLTMDRTDDTDRVDRKNRAIRVIRVISVISAEFQTAPPANGNSPAPRVCSPI